MGFELAELCELLETAGNANDWNVIDEAAPRLPGILEKVIGYIEAL
ncbi:MAG: hypothetical protein HN725_01145 [Alphaproteobacteria bacterium]|nr:hypothetical protein [Alphaproteobacteria bacterium]MBT4082422.1 hypothetical protein [Alphaproteobacteria bacterium]MBT4545964.1 hypothetical protein [Alphaproteobacteria bacterium]MBT7743864.1 hypothetical protein [Alphaproteobacteria bacterium]